MIFESKYAKVDQMFSRDAATIELEPMFYRASFSFANSHAGPLTSDFLGYLRMHAKTLGLDTNELVIDSRTHMLMRGHWPCIPGWHHDDVPRDAPNGQPNYDKPAYHAQHLMVVVDANDARTLALPQMLSGDIEVPWPLDDRAIVYREWDAHINETVGRRGATLSSGEIIHFDSKTFHRGMPARSNGWRWFMRASWDTQVKPENKLRRNANVYLAFAGAGW